MAVAKQEALQLTGGNARGDRRELDYAAGATAEAERAQGLVELLAKTRDHLPVKDEFNKEITDTLTKYNNIK